MGFFSSIKKATSSVASKVKSAVSTASSKASSAVKIVGTNVKNVFSADTLAGAVQGFQQGGIYGAVAGAGLATVSQSMTELDKSGKFNSDYEYKTAGFPSKSEYDLAQAYGYSDYDTWKTVKELLGSNVTTETAVTPASSVASTSVDSSGNLVVSSADSVSSETTDKSSGDGVGGIALGAVALKVLGIL